MTTPQTPNTPSTTDLLEEALEGTADALEEALADLEDAQNLLVRLLDHCARSEGCARSRGLGAFVAPLRPDAETVERVILALEVQGTMVSSDDLVPGLEPVLTPTNALVLDVDPTAGINERTMAAMRAELDTHQPLLIEAEPAPSEIPPISLEITVDGIPVEPLDAWQVPGQREIIELDGGGAARVVDVVWVTPPWSSELRVARIFAVTIDNWGPDYFAEQFGRDATGEDLPF